MDLNDMKKKGNAGAVHEAMNTATTKIGEQGHFKDPHSGAKVDIRAALGDIEQQIPALAEHHLAQKHQLHR